MEGAFFNVEARSSSGPSTCMHALQTLRAFYIGTPHSFLFGEFSTIVYAVADHTSTTFNVKGGKVANAVGYILDTLEHLQQDTPNHIRSAMDVYKDMFIPLMTHLLKDPSDETLLTDEGSGAPIVELIPNTAYTVDSLPHCTHLMMKCSFWTDTKMTPLVHILTKCTPQRCQIRSLAGIIYNYSRLHDDVYTFIRSVAKASLLGIYEHSFRPPIAIRREITETFDKMTRDVFLDWMHGEHQQFLFFAVKEYIVYATALIPSLHAVLRRIYKWDDFERVVRRSMDAVRRLLDGNVMVLHGVEQCIKETSRGTTHMYRPRKTTFGRVLLQECERYCETKLLETVHTTFKIEHQQLLYQMLIRAHTPRIPFEWLQCFGVDSKTTQQLNEHETLFRSDGARCKLRTFVKKMDVYLMERVYALGNAFFKKNNVRVFSLPVHVTLLQIKALRNMHNIRNGRKVKGLGDTYVCFQCKQFRGFAVQRCGQRIHNLCAFGHSKVLVDDVTKKVYCGRRFDNVTKKRASQHAEWEDIALAVEKTKKQAAKDVRKANQMERCALTELQHVSLAGNILQFYNALYTICTKCGNFMKYSPTNFDGNITCGCCVDEGVMFRDIRCMWCQSKTHVSKGIQVKEGKIFLCRTCYKPWIRNASVVLTTETIRTGLAQKWKRLQGV